MIIVLVVMRNEKGYYRMSRCESEVRRRILIVIYFFCVCDDLWGGDGV